MRTVITFEDHDQDFLKWTIDEAGNILECEPFQYVIWEKFRVLNKRFRVGGLITIEKKNPAHPDEMEEITIKYPIEQIEKLK